MNTRARFRISHRPSRALTTREAAARTARPRRGRGSKVMPAWGKGP